MEELIGTTTVPVIAGTTVLDEQSYETVLAMLKSNDEGDHKMAQLILNQLNVQASIYWIWKLSRYSYYITSRMVNLRTKASRKLRDDCNLFSLCNADELKFAVWLKTKNWLTPELFMQVKSGIVSNAKSKTNTHPFYDFYIKIKDDSENLDPFDTLTKLKDYDEE